MPALFPNVVDIWTGGADPITGIPSALALRVAGVACTIVPTTYHADVGSSSVYTAWMWQLVFPVGTDVRDDNDGQQDPNFGTNADWIVDTYYSIWYRVALVTICFQQQPNEYWKAYCFRQPVAWPIVVP